MADKHGRFPRTYILHADACACIYRDVYICMHSLFVGSGTVRTFSTDYALHSPYTGSIIYPCCGEVKARVYIYDNDICTYACRMRVHAYIRMQ